MSAIPNLYLKWLAFRSIIGHPKTDAEIGRAIFGEDQGPIKFSKLLHGDLGCPPEIATEVVKVVNSRVGAYRRARSLGDEPSRFKYADLGLPLYDFVQVLIAAAGTVDDEALDRAHTGLLEEIALAPPSPNGQERLVVERFSASRAFDSMQPSGGSGPVVLEAGKHKGQLAIIGATRAPIAAYTFVTRDTASIGLRLWDQKWGETVLWLPSPSTPTWNEGRLLLMPQPEALKPLPGRFIVTAVLAWDEYALPKIDPRGASPTPGALDEEQTSRFLTNLRRVIRDKRKMWQGAATITSAQYIVTV